MKHGFSHALFCLVTLFAMIPSDAKGNFSGGDDFTSAIPFWGIDTVAGSGRFQLQDGVLNYVTTGPTTTNDTVQREWMINSGEYSSDWSVRVDVAMGGFTMATGQFAAVELLVENAADVPNDLVRIILRRDDSDGRQVYADAFSDGLSAPSAVFLPTQATQATLGLSYDAAARTITTAFDSDGSAGGLVFQRILTVPIASGGSNWHMDPTDTFQAWLVGQSQDLDVLAGGMTFDNFVAAPEQLAIVPEPHPMRLLGFMTVVLMVLSRRGRLFAEPNGVAKDNPMSPVRSR